MYKARIIMVIKAKTSLINIYEIKKTPSQQTKDATTISEIISILEYKKKPWIFLAIK